MKCCSFLVLIVALPLFHVGEHDIKTPSKWEQNYTIKELILHPKYNNNGFHYDLALIKVDGAATFNDRVKPACLPGQNTSFDIGTQCYITGWGLLKEFGHGPAVRILFQLIVQNTIFST